MQRHFLIGAMAIAIAQTVSRAHAAGPSAATATGLCDTLVFGDRATEAAHQLRSDHSDVIAHGGLDQPARDLLPLTPPRFEGGRVAFTMKVDPDRPNYFTVKLWGSDVSRNHLILFVEGKQVGYHHLGDVDQLDFGEEGEPAYNGRFFYTTSPLPESITRGRHELHCEIRCIGPIWGYGQTFDKYQKDLTEPTRGIYAVYTHTDGCFVPPADERQGTAAANPPVRATPGPEVLDALKARVNKDLQKALGKK